MCEAWSASFERFLEDMGPRPSPAHTIERDNNDGHYEPGNCRWATALDQANNRSTTRFVFHQGRRLALSQLAREIGSDARLLRRRLDAGWSLSDAISTPKRVARTRLTAPNSRRAA